MIRNMIKDKENMFKSKEAPRLLPKYWSSKEVLRRACAFVKSQYEKASADHDSRGIKWGEWDDVYRLVDKSKPTDGGATIVDNEPQIIVDTLKSNYLEAVFPSMDKNFEYKGTEDSDAEQAEIMTAYRADHLSRISIREKAERSIHQWLVTGTCIVKTPFVNKTRKKVIVERVPVRANDGTVIKDDFGKPKMKTVKRSVDFPIISDTDWEYVSLYDFIPIGKGADFQEIEGGIHRISTNWDDLLSKLRVKEGDGEDAIEKGVYTNLDSVQPRNFSNFNIYEYHGRIPKDVISGKPEDASETFEGIITCFLDIDNSGERNQKQSHSEKTGEVPDISEPSFSHEGAIRCQENPYWHGMRPFLVCPYTPVDNDLYGIGCIEPLYDKWQELNTTIRQILDNKTLQLLNPTIEDSFANVQRETKLTKFPRIKADDINGVKPLPINDFSANGWRVVASLKDEMRRGSGALETIQGASLKDERVSATEFQGAFQQAGVRIKSRIRLFDEKVFKPFLNICYQNDQQFATVERIIRVVGKKGVRFRRVRPDDIYGTFDIVTYGPLQFENKVIRANKLNNFFAIASRAPQFFNIPELGKQMYIAQELGTEADAEKIVINYEMESDLDIQDEISALSVGQYITAKPNQDHQRHIQLKLEASKELAELGIMDEQSFMAFEDNVNMHIRYLQKKQMQMAAEQSQNGQGSGSGLLAQNGAEAPPSVGQLPTVNPMEQNSLG